MGKVYMFPGQGSQKLGMGKELFSRFPELVERADHILGFSMVDLCTHGPIDKLNQTQYTQPVLFTINVLYYLAEIDKTGILPDFLIGHSLGEYNALYAASAFNFETGLKLVQKRAQLMAQAADGGMAAIIGLRKDQVLQILANNQWHELIIANYNTAEQIVISGLAKQLSNVETIFMREGAKAVVRLPVSGAFHSPFMKSAADAFKTFLFGHEFFQIKIPVISNVTAKPYPNDNVQELLAQQLIQPVQWDTSINYLLEKNDDAQFHEMGPGNVLTKLVNSIKDVNKA